MVGREELVVQTNSAHRSWPNTLRNISGAQAVARVFEVDCGARGGGQAGGAVGRPRIVVAIALAPSLPQNFLSENLAQSLRDETGESVLLVKLVPAAGAGDLAGALSFESILGAGASARVSLPQNNGTISQINLKITAGADGGEPVTPLLRYLGSQFDCVLVQGDFLATPHRTLLEFAGLADSIYLFLPPGADDFRRFEFFASDLRARLQGDVLDIHAVLCLAPEERVNVPLTFCRHPSHAFIHDCPASGFDRTNGAQPTVWFRQDIRRLAREIGHCRLGLALSAGGAKGLAHIGVIQILEENGIEVDVIAGCSMGAYIAAAWAVGCDGGKMEKLARENEKPWGFWRLLDPTFLPRQGFLHGDAVRRRLQQTIGKAQFSDLVRPMRAVATNLDTLDREVFASGSVAEAVQASCAIPGVVVPVTIGSETYIDGGVSDPLPVDVLKEMRVDRIIAVNAIPPSAFLRCCREVEREQAELSKKRFNLLRNINQQINYFARGNILDIMMRAVHGGQIRMAELACGHADVVLRPLAIDAHWHDFNHPVKYIALGRKVALEHLDELKALVKPKATQHEHEATHHEMAALI